MKFSVIIPTYNRSESLRQTLDVFAKQAYQDFEIIVIDDGSTDQTGSLFKKSKWPFLVKYYRQENRGPASARNAGIKMAGGELIFFTGDDIIPSADLLAEHLKIHQAENKENLAVLGFTQWAPQIRLTPFHKFLTDYHFAYKQISDPQNTDWGFFYTSNVSLRKNFLLRAGLFDENFRYAAYEDSELAYRLSHLGMKLVFNARALAFHNHAMDFCGYSRTMFKKGESAVYLVKKVPGLERKASFREDSNVSLKILAKKIAYSKTSLAVLTNFICGLDKMFVPLPHYFYKKILDAYRIQGIKKARGLLN